MRLNRYGILFAFCINSRRPTFLARSPQTTFPNGCYHSAYWLWACSGRAIFGEKKKKKKKKTSVGPETKGLSENNVLESLDLSRSTFSGPSLRTLTQGLHKNKWLSCLKLVRCDLTDENIFGLLSRALLDHPKHSNCSYRSAGKI